MFRNPSGHRSQGAKCAVDLTRNVAGARVRTGERGSRMSPEHDQHHGECWPVRVRWHLVGVRYSWTPVLRKPRHTGAGRPEHPRGRGARVTAGGPPGPCLSRAGGEAARLPSSARRAGSLLFASPRGFPESTPRPTPTLPCPTPGRRGAGPSQGTLAARSALSPPRASSSRFGPGGHASPTPAGRAAAAQCARLRDRVFLVPEAVRGPGAGGEAGSARRAAGHSPCPERSS